MSLTLSRCLRDLKLQGVDLAPEEFCDALWLAACGFLPGETRSSPSAPPEMQSPYSPPLQQPPSINEPIKSPDQIDQQKPGQPVHALSDSGDRKMRGQLLSVPAPPAIARGFEFDRALRPLRQRRQVARSQEVDEEATVAAIAESGIWQIVTRPARSRWLEIVLVVERSPTMRIWQETALDFRKLLWRACAPYSLRTFYLDWSPQKLLLHSSGGCPVSSDAPCHGSGNRLILVLSDAMSVGWLTADIPELLSHWATRQTTTLVQMLPASMWQRTALRHVSLIAADQPRSAIANSTTDDTWPRVTVTTLEPDHLRRYARMLNGAGGDGIAAYRGSRSQFGVVDAPAVERRPPFNPQALSADEIEKIFQRFERSKSPEARNLARHLASAPLILPVMRLVQRVLVPDAAPAQLAEIFLSGILYRRQPATDHEVPPNQVEYEFIPGVRDRLLDLGGLDCSFETIGLLSRYFEERFGKGGAFTALLADPSDTAREWSIAASGAGNDPFARIAGLMRDRYGRALGFQEVVSAGDSKLDLHSSSNVASTASDPETASAQYDAVAEVHLFSDSDEKFASRVRDGMAEITKTLELIPSVRSPVELVQQIGKLFNTAIHHGAQIWNDGSHLGCCELYHFAAGQLLKMVSQTGEPVSEIVQAFLDDLLDTLRESPSLTNATAKCWELRHRFDRFNAIAGIEEITALKTVRSRRATPVSADDIREMGQIALAHGMVLYHAEDWMGCALLYSFCAQQIVAITQIKPLNREVQLLVRAVSGSLTNYPEVPLDNDLAKRCAWDFYDALKGIVEGDRESSAPQYDAVISYRREGGTYLARQFHQAIKDRGYQTFLDVDELHAGEYPYAIRNVTENSPSLILLLTHGALDRCCIDSNDWVRQQILHAREHGKTIIPVTAPNFRFPELPPELEFVRDLQSVPLSDDFFEATIDTIIRLMDDARRLPDTKSMRFDSLPAMQSIRGTAASIGQESIQDRQGYDAVISYRREGGSFLARVIRQALKDRGNQTFLDVDELHAGDYPQQYLRNIENSPSLILVLSRGALDLCCQDSDDSVRCEILHAREHGKNIIPVMDPKFRFPKLPPELEFLRHLRGVPVSDDFFDAMIDRLIQLMGDGQRPPAELTTKSKFDKVPPKTPTLFISYSHDDEVWMERLRKQLAFLPIRQASWHDRNIKGGDDWKSQILKSMDQASLAILLVTPDFLGSEFIREVEVPRLLERHQAGELRLYPIIVSHCDWKYLDWLKRLNCRPKDGKPLDTYFQESVTRGNEQLAIIADEIAGLLSETKTDSADEDNALSLLAELVKKSDDVAKPPLNIESAIQSGLADVDEVLAGLAARSVRLKLDDVELVVSTAIGQGAGIYNHSDAGRVGCARIYHRAAAGLLELIPEGSTPLDGRPPREVHLAAEWLRRIVMATPLVRERESNDLTWELRFAFDAIQQIPICDEISNVLADLNLTGTERLSASGVISDVLQRCQSIREDHVGVYVLRHTAQVVRSRMAGHNSPDGDLIVIRDRLKSILSADPRIVGANVAVLAQRLTQALSETVEILVTAKSASRRSWKRWIDPRYWFSQK